uniref:Putative ovule protein n=1 Tax=Solanum chacoense TaxID=4108 RepID=A0A0V0IB13_SOLCH
MPCPKHKLKRKNNFSKKGEFFSPFIVQNLKQIHPNSAHNQATTLKDHHRTKTLPAFRLKGKMS